MKIGLIAGRHELPVEKYVFQGIDNVLDFGKMEMVAREFLATNEGDIDLYVTGLSSALVAFINSAVSEGNFGSSSRKVTCWHFDMSTGSYVPQELVQVVHAPYGY